MRPNVAFGASNAPNATLGASNAPNATLGRSTGALRDRGERREQRGQRAVGAGTGSAPEK
ncbi:hypothetical protein GCM10023192_17900 [Amycolatopsis samaneae]